MAIRTITASLDLQLRPLPDTHRLMRCSILSGGRRLSSMRSARYNQRQTYRVYLRCVIQSFGNHAVATFDCSHAPAWERLGTLQRPRVTEKAYAQKPLHHPGTRKIPLLIRPNNGAKPAHGKILDNQHSMILIDGAEQNWTPERPWLGSHAGAWERSNDQNDQPVITPHD